MTRPLTTPTPKEVFDTAPVIAELELHNITALEAAIRVGVSERTFQRWCKAGFTVSQADEVAVRVLGRHPVLVWPSAWVVSA